MNTLQDAWKLTAGALALVCGATVAAEPEDSFSAQASGVVSASAGLSGFQVFVTDAAGNSVTPNLGTFDVDVQAAAAFPQQVIQDERTRVGALPIISAGVADATSSAQVVGFAKSASVTIKNSGFDGFPVWANGLYLLTTPGYGLTLPNGHTATIPFTLMASKNDLACLRQTQEQCGGGGFASLDLRNITQGGSQYASISTSNNRGRETLSLTDTFTLLNNSGGDVLYSFTSTLLVGTFKDGSVVRLNEVVVPSIPEPGSTALLLAGLGVVGGVAAWRQRNISNTLG